MFKRQKTVKVGKEEQKNAVTSDRAKKTSFDRQQRIQPSADNLLQAEAPGFSFLLALMLDGHSTCLGETSQPLVTSEMVLFPHIRHLRNGAGKRSSVWKIADFPSCGAFN